MEKRCVLVPFPIPMCLAALPPNGLLAIQEFINFPFKLVNFCSPSASVYHGERIESSFLFLNFLWNIAYHIMIPIC